MISIGLHPKALDYSTLPDGVDEASLTARIERSNAALREAGYDVVLCQVGTSPDTAEQLIRDALDGTTFGLAMIGGGIRMLPDYTELFERIVNVCNAASPGISFCFNTSPETTLDALRRHVKP